MPVARRLITQLQNLDDVNIAPGAGIDQYSVVYDHASGKFVTLDRRDSAIDHGSISGLGDDDHTQYLLATGARTGASSSAQTFTNGIIGPSWTPASDGASAIQIRDTFGVSVVNVNTNSKKIGINTTAPQSALDVIGNSGDTIAAAFFQDRQLMLTRFENMATASVSNETGFEWRAKTSTQSRTIARFVASLANIDDANRQSSLSLKLNENGQFITAFQWDGTKFFAGGASTPTAFVDVAGSKASNASIRIRSGSAPTTPNTGDLWFDGTNLKFYDGTTTRTINWT